MAEEKLQHTTLAESASVTRKIIDGLASTIPGYKDVRRVTYEYSDADQTKTRRVITLKKLPTEENKILHLVPEPLFDLPLGDEEIA